MKKITADNRDNCPKKHEDKEPDCSWFNCLEYRAAMFGKSLRATEDEIYRKLQEDLK